MSTFKLDNLVWRAGEVSANSQYSVTADKVVWGVSKGWITFNGNTTTIRKSYNVSSLTNYSTGLNYVGMTISQPDINYTVSGFCSSNLNYNGQYAAYDWPKDSSSFWTYSGWSGTLYNLDYNGAALHR